jgi:murein tripeptide amidase MpaA
MAMTALARNVLVALVIAAPRLAAQTWPQTAAERTSFAATSSSGEVGAFLDSLQMAGAPISVSEMGRTALGKPILLAVASDPPVTSPAEAAASGRLVVYLQANIHAGEVEGKEAVLILLRELATTRRELLQQLVVLAAPDYNPDGNDAFGPVAVNRGEQAGPDLVGQRADALNLDLNRDYFKAEAPETRASLARVYATWDPALMVDCHTTDGTLHGYLLTYAPPLDPVGPRGPMGYVSGQMLPALRRTLEQKYHEPIFDYGNVDDPLDPKSWDTYAPLGWYGTNYVGLRGRMAILSEAYSHADFRTRVQVTHDFLVEVLAYAATHAEEIRRVVREADRQTTLEGTTAGAGAGVAARPDLAVQ